MSEPKGENGSGFVTRDEFYAAMKELGQDLGRRIEKMSTEVSSVERSARPNFATMASWASVIVSICGLLGASMFYHFNTRFALQEQARSETFTQVNTRIERLENNEDDDRMDEVRRYRDLIHDKINAKE